MNTRTDPSFLDELVARNRVDLSFTLVNIHELAPGLLIADQVHSDNGEPLMPSISYDMRLWNISQHDQENSIMLEEAAKNNVFGNIGELDWDEVILVSYDPTEGRQRLERVACYIFMAVGDAEFHETPIDITEELLQRGLESPAE